MTVQPLMARLSQRLPFYGLAFLCVFLPFYNSLAGLGIGLTGLGVLAALFGRGRRQLLSRDLGPVYLFFGACLIATLANPQTLSLSLVGLRKALLYLFIVIGCRLALRNQVAMKRCLGLVSAAAVTAALDGYYQLFAGRDFFSLRPLMTYPQGMVIRITGPFQQAATLAIYLECVLAGLFVALLAPLQRSKVREMAAAAVLTGALILTFTSASPLALGTVFFIATIALRRPRLNVLFGGVPLLFLSIPTEMRAHLMRLLTENILHRGRMLQIGWQIFRERPLFGHGLNTFSHSYVAHAGPGDPFYGMGGPYAHNMYMHLACETGLLGLAAFLGLLVFILRRLLRREADGPANGKDAALRTGLAMALIAYLIHGFLESSLQTSHGALIFWVLTGLCLATFGFTRRENLV